MDKTSEDDSLGITYVTMTALRAPSGGLVVLSQVEQWRLVNCVTYTDTIDTIDRIISDAMYAGLPCPSRPDACAAAFSVPDGAPIEMAIDNLGCELSEAAADKMSRWAQERRDRNAAMRRGPRH